MNESLVVVGWVMVAVATASVFGAIARQCLEDRKTGACTMNSAPPTPHRYTIVSDGPHALKIISTETGVVIAKGIDGRDHLAGAPSLQRAWQQARRIRDGLESGSIAVDGPRA